MTTVAAPAGRLQRWVGRPAFWWTAIALVAGGPLVSGLLRRPPPPLPVLDRVPATGKGRLVVFADPSCPVCIATSQDAVRSLSRHLRLVRPGFEVEWASPGDAGAVRDLLERSPRQVELRRGERAVLIDPAGRVRAFPLLRDPPGRELLPAIAQVVNGR